MKHEAIISKIESLGRVIGNLEAFVKNMEGMEEERLDPAKEMSSYIPLSEFMDHTAIEMIHDKEERVSAVIAKLREIFILEEPKSPS